VSRDHAVLLAVPADGAYLGVLRTAAAGLAARLQFTLDEIEDLRIAVDEACAMLIRLTAPSEELRCRFSLDGERLRVEVAVPGAAPGPDTSSFAWQVLTSLTGEASARLQEDTVSIALTARREVGATARREVGTTARREVDATGGVTR
jgi:serine/threonine-protein kinase RsbW